MGHQPPKHRRSRFCRLFRQIRVGILRRRPCNLGAGDITSCRILSLLNNGKRLIAYFYFTMSCDTKRSFLSTWRSALSNRFPNVETLAVRKERPRVPRSYVFSAESKAKLPSSQLSAFKNTNHRGRLGSLTSCSKMFIVLNKIRQRYLRDHGNL
jgi:hypothetical protein